MAPVSASSGALVSEADSNAGSDGAGRVSPLQACAEKADLMMAATLAGMWIPCLSRGVEAWPRGMWIPGGLCVVMVIPRDGEGCCLECRGGA